MRRVHRGVTNMAHNIKAKQLKYNYALYARLKSTVFSSRLQALWLVISWSGVGSEFHAAGKAGERKAPLGQVETSCTRHNSKQQNRSNRFGSQHSAH